MAGTRAVPDRQAQLLYGVVFQVVARDQRPVRGQVGDLHGLGVELLNHQVQPRDITQAGFHDDGAGGIPAYDVATGLQRVSTTLLVGEGELFVGAEFARMLGQDQVYDLAGFQGNGHRFALGHAFVGLVLAAFLAYRLKHGVFQV